MNLFVQMLENRAQRVLKNADGESKRTLGLGIPSILGDRVVGSPSSANFDEGGEADCCLVTGTSSTVGSMVKVQAEGRPSIEIFYVGLPLRPGRVRW